MKIFNTLLLLFTIGLVFTSFEVEGADWRLWHKGTDGILFYYDAKSITPTSKDTVIVTGKIEGSHIALINPKTKEIIDNYKTKKVPCSFEFNCSLKKYRMLSSKIEYEDGQQDELKNPDPEWIHIPYKSFFEPFYNEVCQ